MNVQIDNYDLVFYLDTGLGTYTVEEHDEPCTTDPRVTPQDSLSVRVRFIKNAGSGLSVCRIVYGVKYTVPSVFRTG